MSGVEPEPRPRNVVSARHAALIKREIDESSERDKDDVLAELVWTAWPTVWGQDQ
jgi:hypothetical protein